MAETESSKVSMIQILREISSKIPVTLSGVDKQIFIGKELLGKLPEQHILGLQRLFNLFLREMRKRSASDIDIGGWGSNGKIWMRIQGVKKPIDELGTYSTTQMDILIQSLLMERQKKLLYEKRNLDFSYTMRDEDEGLLRYRSDTYFESNCLALNMRAINKKVYAYKNFEFHENVTKMLSLDHTKEGLILVTGITGSGKSTTLDSIIDLNNNTVEGHIVIIAAPIEFVHHSNKCLMRHREVGRDTMSFKSGTVEALRQDPDIIMIGEMRDPDTIMSGLEAADSGHKVLSTLHTSSAIESIARIVGEVPSEEQERVRTRLADTLKCVISQKLLPGLKGERVLAKEILLMTPSIKAAILNNNIGEIYQMIGQGQKLGMTTIEQDLARLFLQRKISLSSAINFANNKRRLEQILKIAKERGNYA